MEKLTPKEIEKRINDTIKTSSNPELEEMLEDAGTDGDIKGLMKALYYNEGDLGSLTDFVPDLKIIEEYNRDDYGAEAYVAFKYLPTDQLVGFEGWYSSEEGFSAEGGFSEMEAYEVTRYRKAKKVK